MAKRKSLSLRVRFGIFKRDLFTCQYCGKTPPSTVLEVDHLMPVSKGGDNSEDNLITSCFECNRGKYNIELSELPQTATQKLEALKERELQYCEYQKMLLSIDNRINREVEVVNRVFSNYFPEREFAEHFKVSVKKFIKELGLYAVIDSMERACAKVSISPDALNYFCGICWRKIKNDL